MRVTHISTFDRQGGAAIAARRLHEALRREGVDSSMLVLHASGEEEHIASVINSPRDYYAYKAGTAIDERTVRYIKKKGAGSFSLARFGRDIYRHPWVREADIVQLHWLQGGYVSLSGLKKAFDLQKPVIWTMHDMWPFTGGCHYSGGCAGYTGDCAGCPMLKDRFGNTTRGVLSKKRRIYRDAPLFPVGCSTWLADIASGSTAFQGIKVRALPNPIDTEVYRPMDKKQARKNLGLSENGTYILFGAASPGIKRKGFKYLAEALGRIGDRGQLLVYGADTMPEAPGLSVKALGRLDREDLRNAYGASDVFVVPSLEDNLPNTVMEAMACGTPVAAFDAGGISDMIEHTHTGYLAEIRSSEDLARGILWCLDNGAKLGENARRKVEENYAYPTAAQNYIKLYEEALS